MKHLQRWDLQICDETIRELFGRHYVGPKTTTTMCNRRVGLDSITTEIGDGVCPACIAAQRAHEEEDRELQAALRNTEDMYGQIGGLEG